MRLRNNKLVFSTREPEAVHNHEILARFPKHREYHHRFHVSTAWTRYPLSITLSSMLEIPFFTFDHLQDFCSKSVALYAINMPEIWGKADVEEYVYQKWSRGDLHGQDIEFNHFLVKFVGLKAEGRRMGVDDVRVTHTKLLHLLNKYEFWFSLDLDITLFDGDCMLDQKQAQYHRLESLYKALFIVIQDHEEIVVDKNTLVKLVRTGSSEGLSEPFDFEVFGKKDEDVVVVTLDQALEYVMKMEDRERKANFKEESSVLHEQLGGVQYWKWMVETEGFTGNLDIGPSLTWIKTKE